VKKLPYLPALCTAVLLSALHLPALAAGGIEVKSTAEREVAVVNNGKKELKRAPVDKAVPGDVIIYTTTFKNLSGKPAGNIVINNPLPNDSVYQSGSASGANTVITFSVDGGKTFAAPGQLSVKTADGKTRPALATDYTHIRWAYQGELGVNKAGAVSFRAAIK